MSRLLWAMVTAVLFVAGIGYLSVNNMAADDTHKGHDHESMKIHAKWVKEARKKNLELVSQPPDPSVTDEIAAGLVFRFVSGSVNESEKEKSRQYLSGTLGIHSRTDQDVLFNISEAYKLAANQIQMNSEATTAKYHPQHNTISESDRRTLEKLRRDKLKLIQDSLYDLKRQMSREGFDAFTQGVETRVKPRVKPFRH